MDNAACFKQGGTRQQHGQLVLRVLEYSGVSVETRNMVEASKAFVVRGLRGGERKHTCAVHRQF